MAKPALAVRFAKHTSSITPAQQRFAKNEVALVKRFIKLK